MATINQDTGVAMFTLPSSSLSSKYGRVWLQKKQDCDGYNAKLEVPKRQSTNQWVRGLHWKY